jgi:hypothetical protein
MGKTTGNQAHSTSSTTERVTEYTTAKQYETTAEPTPTTPPRRAEIPDRVVVVSQQDQVKLKYDTQKEAQRDLFRRMNRK